MEKQVILTADGSHTIAIPQMGVTYHSRHGAIRESEHVFIRAGLHHLLTATPPRPLHIFEMGFGTGLNAFLTAIQAQKLRLPVHYTALEPHPLTTALAAQLNYPHSLGHQPLFTAMHTCGWQEQRSLNEYFTLEKLQTTLAAFSAPPSFHLLYYDAFAPAAQPELWTVPVFQKLFALLLPGGCLLTYCAKGDVRRALATAGFTITKLPGPPGKREMLRAQRPPAP